MAQPTIQQTFDLALQHHQAGRLREAEQLYRQILAQQPDHAEALHLSGVLAVQAGRLDAGVEFIRRAIAICSTNAFYHSNLGKVLRDKGQLDQAIDSYRQAIRLKPDLAEVHFNLGNALKDKEQLQEAIASYRQAIRLKPDYAEAHCNLANALKDNEQLDQAIASYRQAIRLKPGLFEAHCNLGNALRTKGQLDEAIGSHQRAIGLKPDSAEAHNNLGGALMDKGQLDEAMAAFRRAIALGGNYAEAHCNLGGVLRDKGRLDEAIAACRQAIALRGNYAQAHNNLGNALKDKGQLDEAIAAYRQAIASRPDYAEARGNLGIALKGKGQLDEAIAAYRRAIALRPNYAEAHNNLGVALKEKGQLDEGIAACRQAIALRPNYPEAHSNLGSLLRDKGQLDEAIGAFRQAIRMKPDFAAPYSNLGALADTGQLDEAIASQKQAVRLKPDFAGLHSNLIFTVHYHPDYDAKMIHEELGRWNRQHAEPLMKLIRPHLNNRDPDRRLRIGYVSPDFRVHVVGQNLLPLLRQHDHGQMEIFCYSNVVQPDVLTEQLRGYADVWRNIVGLSDSQAVDLIRQDGIDILVDLALHTGNNRLLVFAHKPAPVQVTYLGYCGSTGLETMDYRLSDPHLDPPDSDLSLYSERTIRLPETYWCYGVPGSTPEPSPPPAATAGYVTFGCLNNSAKVSPPALDLWAEIMRRVPRSRLIVHSPPGAHLDAVRERFAGKGISSDRLEFAGRQPWPQYVRTYGRIDIALDPFPWGGGITTCDALWMGVPVVSLVGRTSVGRGGASILANLGVPELIAKVPQQYVQIATDLAKDLPRLAELRRTLRPRMQGSPLMDAPRFARNVEAAYRQMWRNWCEKGGVSGLQCPAP
jgi:predicted O-linked N-acetylglucosamine transferase (SPINDLY family)